MKKTASLFSLNRSIAPGMAASLLTLFLLAPAPVQALQVTTEDGIKVSLDTTLSLGLTYRVSDQDPELIGIANEALNGGRGTAYSVNFDDGNLNYNKGVVSKVAKITSELGIDYKKFGLFVRGTGFYDYENMRGDRAKSDLSSEALELVGKDIRLLDAFVKGEVMLGSVPLQVRLGEQVLSWGESTFIQNGINVINPVNVNSLRVPGAEIKEALLPEGLVWASISPVTNVSLEGFYLYDWAPTEIDPAGSFWSTNDFVGNGGDKVMLGWGDVSDMGRTPALNTFMAVPRAQDIYADDSGQFGIALRTFVPALNETEFGFYYMNYHSRLPLISSRTGTGAGLTAAGTISAVAPNIIGSVLINGGNPANAIATYSPVIGARAATLIAGATAQAFAASGGNAGVAQSAGGDATRAVATDAYGKTARYQIEYPEDIQLFGFSFNTLLQGSGVALQGEYSYRKDAPLQLDDIELLLATLEPAANPVLDPTYSQFSRLVSAPTIIANGGQAISIAGYERFDISQGQMTATKLFGPTFGANQFALVGEAGITRVHGMPKKSEMRLDGPGTPVSGNPNHALNRSLYPLAAHSGKAAEPYSAFADATSWGYRLVGRLDFNNAIGAVTLSPRLAWAHDVNGNSPGPGGNFVEGRKAVTIGLGADYQNRWGADLSYTNFFGAGRYNLINDRDIIAANIKYSF